MLPRFNFSPMESEILKQIQKELTTQCYEEDPYNEHQNFLYKRALYGLSAYTPDKIVHVSHEKKMSIMKQHRKCQTLLNIWKQQITNQRTNALLKQLFPNSEVAKVFTEVYKDDVDPEFLNVLKLSDLGITKDKIIQKLIAAKLLPKKFMELK